MLLSPGKISGDIWVGFCCVGDSQVMPRCRSKASEQCHVCEQAVYPHLEGVQSWLRSLINATVEAGRDSEVGHEGEEPGRTCRGRGCKVWIFLQEEKKPP